MTPADEARTLRQRQARLAAEIARRDSPTDPAPQSFLGVIVREKGDPWPPTAGTPYKVKVAYATGPDTIGATLKIKAVGTPILARNEGGGVPPDPDKIKDDAHQTYVLVLGVGGTRIFNYGAR